MAFSRMPDDVKSVALGARMVIHSRYDSATSFRLQTDGFFASRVRSDSPFTLTFGDETRCFDREALMLVGPGGSVTCAFTGPIEGQFVSMTPEAIAQVLGAAGPYAIPTSFHGPEDETVAWHLVRATSDCMAKGQGVDPLVYEGLLDTLVRVIAIRDIAQKRVPSLSVDQACATRATILGGLGGPLSVGDLARAVSLSEGYFARAFKESFGTSPYQYISRERVALARSLIGDKQNSLETVASKAGFTNVAQMTRALKMHSGHTARAMRAAQARFEPEGPASIHPDAANPV